MKPVATLVPANANRTAAGRSSTILHQVPEPHPSAVAGVSCDLDQMAVTRLAAMLEAFGEYPARYRLAIW